MIDWTWHIALPNLIITVILVFWLTHWVRSLVERGRRETVEELKSELPPVIVPHLFNHERLKELDDRLERLESTTNYLDHRFEVHLKGLRGGTEPGAEDTQG
jgi:lipopolysaccharide export LptBFGC system permease protein LptF